MGVLAALLEQPTAPEPDPVDPDALSGSGTYTQAGVLPRQPSTPNELLELFGHDPERFAIEGNVTVRHRELLNGSTVSTYGYKLRPAPESLDIDDLILAVESAKPEPRALQEGPYWFVYQAGDLQLGKRSRDGSTEQIIRKYMQSTVAAVIELEALADEFGVEGVQLCFPGDCMEGIVSQGGKNLWLTPETMTEQTRIFRRLLLWTVDKFRKAAPRIYLDVVNGNHDQAQRAQNTKPGDGWATECAIAVADALQLNEAAYGHVEVRVPDSWSGHMTVPVGDSLVTVAHGHQWRRGKGMDWWAEQALNLQAPTTAGVLQHGHGHTFEVETTRDRIRIAGPTFDMGSDWYREVHGGESKTGGLVYLLQNNELSRLSIV